MKHIFWKSDKGLKKILKQNKIVFFTIKASKVKRFLILDFLTGTGIYYAFKIISSSVLVGVVGSTVCTTGIKKFLNK